MNQTSPQQKAKPEREFVVVRPLRRHGVQKQPGDRIRFPSGIQIDRDQWLAEGSIRALTDAERAASGPAPTRTKPATAGAAAVSAGGQGSNQVQSVPLAQIRPDPTQPRKSFEPEPMAELVASVKAGGIEQAILVRPMSRWRQIVSFVARQWVKRQNKIEGYGIAGSFMRKEGIECVPMEEFGANWMDRLVAEGRVEKIDPASVGYVPAPGALAPLTGETTLPGEPEWYEIVYGERRWRAAQAAGLTEIPAKVRELTDIEAAEKQAVENLERADLLPLEVAAQYRKLLDLPGYGMERLMETTGHAKNTIYGKLKLLELPDEAREAVQRGELGQITAERIARLKGDEQKQAVKRILHPPRHFDDSPKVLTDRQAQQEIERIQREAEAARKIEKMKAAAIARGLIWVEEGSAPHKHIFGQHYSGQPKPDSGLLNPKSVVPGDSKFRCWGELLALKSVRKAAKDLQPTTATTHYGELLELYPAKAVHEAVRAAGLELSNKRQSADPAESKRKAKEKLMRATVDAAARAIMLRSQKFVNRVTCSAEVTEMWRGLARGAVDCMGHEALAGFVRRRGIEPATFQGGRGKPLPDYPKTALKYLAGKGATELAGIVAELLITRDAWWSHQPDFNQAFVLACGEFGLDLEQLKAEQGGAGEGEEPSAGARNGGKARQAVETI